MKIMRKFLLVLILSGIFTACKKHKDLSPPPPPPPQAVLLKDIVHVSLPSSFHFFLLPGVKLQKNNPGKETFTGDSDNYTVNCPYRNNNNGAPIAKTGDLVFLTGTRTGQYFTLNSTYS